ncbi:MAG TPA: threonine/serine dehydratase [Stellaceae bacterium]|nr:threonine/serine dehydratase [Stellaceae bacterium]
MPAPDADAIRAAAARIAPFTVATPLLSSPLLDARAGLRLLVKAESLQRTGSFKWRGAINALLSLDAAARQRGVVAFSSGNHAQGVAAAAQTLGIRAVVVMPADAPAIKAANTRAYGAEVVLYDRHTESREAIAERLAIERGAALIPPYDDARIVAGQASVGLELAAQARAMDVALDAVIVPCSGGGLLAGVALALHETSPRTKIYAAEPDGFDDMRRSLAAGVRITNDTGGQSLCDCLLAPIPGELPFAVARQHVAGSIVVSDGEICRAMAAAFADLKLVLEPGGAAGLAAALGGTLARGHQTIAVVASGGNVDRETFSAALRRSPA